MYRLLTPSSRAEGRAEGEATLLLKLLKLLELRFGPVPEAARSQVAAATPAQLEAWAARVLTASTLDEVLAP